VVAALCRRRPFRRTTRPAAGSPLEELSSGAPLCGRPLDIPRRIDAGGEKERENKEMVIPM
jgi:hypothetical protein